MAEQASAPEAAEAQQPAAGFHDAVFGNLTEKTPNYRSLGWLATAALMMKTQIGLGVLSIPAVFDTLGLVPGIACLLAVGAITSWSNYMVGVFKLRHPEVYGVDEAGALMFGRLGREVLGASFCIFWVFVAGSGMLGISIGLNAVSSHGACTAGFVVAAAVVGFSLASIRTLGRISWIAWVGLVCILVSIFVVTVAVALQDRPAAAPRDGPWTSDFQLFKKPSFAAAVSAVSSLVFSYAGAPAFFSIASEMRDPRDYNRALVVCQAGVTSVFVVIGTVVYYFCGSYVASPALGSAGPLVKRVAYGLALPGLVATTTLVIHLPAKHAFLRLLRGSSHLTANSFVHWSVWLGCTLAITLAAYLIASGIPFFGGLVSLVGALLGTLMAFQPMGCMWLYDNWSEGRRAPSPGWACMVAFSVFVVVSGTFLMVAGTYGSVVGIVDAYDRGEGSAAWTCADNSNSVASS
ncbi:uncharacterized protein UV8b_07074 [Ustilaginoidea virens]|uniref:Amino acid transporter transmembrane domain-containing protein n=1 Tax=Ustilaginoidea virens TaxID=1159556 RepID=A0A1B5KWG5_USTVR|nr:uncharacterized protein UV8b_07074 [Ustilaginoidea virens]QUC22833.1 hypothetical protein UV8b_07074 [Ustilaginoidea virens]GAO15366.1 hypothetical protein UVI_02010300 [Ustilaginoidea virens]